ncbi:MAG: SDR family NAD(P)-dependent oxidoreductase, partial [bacterium]
MNLNGNVVIVTGGASGLGAATSRMVAAAGGKVLIADVNQKLGDAMVAELGAAAAFVRCDVTSEADGNAAVAAAQAMG